MISSDQIVTDTNPVEKKATAGEWVERVKWEPLIQFFKCICCRRNVKKCFPLPSTKVTLVVFIVL